MRMGGRLVYFMPAFNEAYKDEHEPQHGCFRIVANEDQMLTKKWARRLIVMVKNMEYDQHVNAVARGEVIGRITEHMRIAQHLEFGNGESICSCIARARARKYHPTNYTY